jgi:glycosyltransferase involved in cell wall biosynthesis
MGEAVMGGLRMLALSTLNPYLARGTWDSALGTPLRILHISTRLILGGSQENTVLSCEGQARRGHEVHLAYGPIYGPEGSMLGRVERFNESLAGATASGASLRAESAVAPIVCHEVPHLVREINPLADWRCFGELRRLIREIRPDVVHTHSSKAGILGRAAAWTEGGREGRIRVVHTIHGPPFHKYETWWRNRLYIRLERWAAKRCHVIVSVADAMTRQFLGAGIGRREQYVTVRSGMEFEPFETVKPGESRAEMRAAMGLAASDIVIGTVSRLAEHKGHDDLLDALAEEVRRRREVKLLWVGDGWWRGRLTRRVEELGLRGRVVMTGLVPPERIPALVRAMDLVVHPSYREGLPRVVPQALLSGVPVVAYDVDGTGEACIDRETGRLVGAGDVAGLRDAVAWMLEDPSRAKATAERGRALCRTWFSAAAMVDRLETVYASASCLVPAAS